MTQREIENQKKTKQEDLAWGQAEDEEGFRFVCFHGEPREDQHMQGAGGFCRGETSQTKQGGNYSCTKTTRT